MYTYGYIREATMAHIDADEEEAQAMHLLERFHIYANEAMQAICGSKPMYKYFEATIVPKYAPLVRNRDDSSEATIRLATKDEIANHEKGIEDPDLVWINDVQVKDYWHERGVYEVFEKIPQNDDTFIAYANKQAWKNVEHKPTTQELLEAESFNRPLPKSTFSRERVENGLDFAYISRNQLKFYKPGHYLIPGKYLWYRFESGVSDDQVIDMPADILLTIPLYIASICLQIDTPQKANIKRNEFETALARCTNTDFMELPKVKSSW